MRKPDGLSIGDTLCEEDEALSNLAFHRRILHGYSTYWMAVQRSGVLSKFCAKAALISRNLVFNRLLKVAVQICRYAIHVAMHLQRDTAQRSRWQRDNNSLSLGEISRPTAGDNVGFFYKVRSARTRRVFNKLNIR